MDEVADQRAATVLLRAGALLALAAWMVLLGIAFGGRWNQLGAMLFLVLAGWLLLAALVAVGVAVGIGAVVTARRTRRAAPRQYRLAGLLLATWAMWFAMSGLFLVTFD